MSIRKRRWVSGGLQKTAWVVDYRDQHGRRRAKQLPTRKEAVNWQPRAAVEVLDGIHTADSASITIAAAGELWIAACRADGLERGTLVQYRRHLDIHIAPMIGAIKLSALTAPAVKQFRSRLAGSRSPAMVKKILTSLGSLVAEAQGSGMVAQNVVRAGRRKSRGIAGSRHRVPLKIGETIPTKEEVKAILGAAAGRWRPFIATAALTGMRASELRGLAWRSVSFDDKMIRVEQRADEWGVIGPPKSVAGRRVLIIPANLIRTLKEWRLACPRGKLGMVFPNGAGRVESLSNIHTRGYKPTLAAAGVKNNYTLHALRHFYASWLIDQGFGPKKVQTLMGHASITMTYDLYGHLFPADEEDYVKLSTAESDMLA